MTPTRTTLTQRPARTMGRRTVLAGAGGAAAALMGVGACSKQDDGGGNGGGGGSDVTITLSGPNQWNDSGSSFGPAWEKLVAAFEAAEPGIKVKTVVLPLNSFRKTISTQLAAGTAPELVFNQASYKPYMVHHLDDELTKPNPYVEGNEHWIDVFLPKYFGPDAPSIHDPEGHINWIPFNFNTGGIFYNADMFSEVGVEPPKTFAEMIEIAPKFWDAGYTPFAAENTNPTVGWTITTIANMMMRPHFDEMNVFDATGKPGTAAELTSKDWARAIATGVVTTKTPEVTASLKLLKQFFDTCATKNWSGISGNSGAVLGLREFSSGKAATAWGTSYAKAALTDAKFTISSMPFPTITKESSPVATGAPGQWGVTLGGTCYMIPAQIKGDKLAAAIKFLQFVSAPKNIQPWLDATGAVPAVQNVAVPKETQALLEGAWGEPRTMGSVPNAPAGTTVLSLYDGYLLGSKDLSQEQDHLQKMWDGWTEAAIKKNEWSDEAWAKDK